MAGASVGNAARGNFLPACTISIPRRSTARPDAFPCRAGRDALSQVGRGRPAWAALVVSCRRIPVSQPLMPHATASWLVDNTALSFDQIAEVCEIGRAHV